MNFGYGELNGESKIPDSRFYTTVGCHVVVMIIMKLKT